MQVELVCEIIFVFHAFWQYSNSSVGHNLRISVIITLIHDK